MHVCRAVLILFLLIGGLVRPAFSQEGDVAGSADHPLIPRYAGSEIRGYETSAFDEFRLIAGKMVVQDGSVVPPVVGSERPIDLEGRVTHIFYRAPAERSSLEVFRNYERALAEAGFETLFSCAREECGPQFNRAINPGPRYDGLLYDSQQRYLAARLPRPEGDVYISLYVTTFDPQNRAFVQLDVVEVEGMEERMEVVEASEMEEALARDGRIAIYGIHFDFDKADLKPESQPQVEQLGGLLAGNPGLNVLIVGHTDGQGGFDYNLSLSQRRAQAVADALVSGFGIAAGRLTPAGAGMVSPVATNRTEEGRAKNRRVEIVELVR